MYAIVLENLLFSKNFVSRQSQRGPAVLMHRKRQDLKSESSSLKNKNLHPLFFMQMTMYVFLIQRFVYSGKCTQLIQLVYRHSIQIILKQIMQIKHNRIKNPNWREAASWLFTSVAEDLNLGRQRTNPASGQSRTLTRDGLIASLTR